MIEVTGVTKSYGPIEALRGVTFSVAPREVVGLLGPNGAGKSTTIKILTGYLQPDSGQVQVDGLDVLANTIQVQERIGYLPENAPLYPELSVQRYLKLVAELRQIPESDQIQRISEAVHATGLQNHLVRPIGELSKGFRQRVGLAQAILHQPRLLILDEPTIGLDPTQVVEIRHLLKRLAETSTILFSSHILSEVEAICDRVIIIMNGEVRADARLADLEATPDAILVLEKDVPGVDAALRQMKDVRQVEKSKIPGGYPQFRVLGKPAGDGIPDLCPAIYAEARTQDWPVRELRRDVRTLENVFNELAMGVQR